MTRLLEGKVGLVTGAGSGIGRATALVFAREGARMAVVDWNAAGAEETCALVRAEGCDKCLDCGYSKCS